MLNENPAQTQDEFALQLGVTQQSIAVRLHQLGKIEKLGRWIQYGLSLENKQRRFDMAMSLLTRYKMKNLLYKIITGDKKWVLYDNPKKKSWVDPGRPSTSTAKANIYKKSVIVYFVRYEGRDYIISCCNLVKQLMLRTTHSFERRN